MSLSEAPEGYVISFPTSKAATKAVLPNKRAMALYTCVEEGNKSVTVFDSFRGHYSL